MAKTALVVMARNPEEGKVKTRLAVTIGTSETLRIYKAFLSDLAQRFAGWQEEAYTMYWAYTPSEADFALNVTALVPSARASRYFAQCGPDLGSSLRHAFHTTAAFGFQQTILIGSDAPQLGREMITQACQALEGADVVLGPAEDGGYYLIAMRKPYDLFSKIPMSTPQVLQMTMERAHRLGLSVHLLEPLFDIDELPELLRLKALLTVQPELAPLSAAVICSLSGGLL
ncbi:MAG: glycosyltransferase [Chloroflexi bacterium]|nr:MAG: glycosyltransferase [Chloroflexota bacterium]